MLNRRSVPVWRGPSGIAQLRDLPAVRFALVQGQSPAAFPAQRLKNQMRTYHRRHSILTPLHPTSFALLPKTVGFLPLFALQIKTVFQRPTKKAKRDVNPARPPHPELPHLASREIFLACVSHPATPLSQHRRGRQRRSWFWLAQAGLPPTCAKHAMCLMSNQS